MYVGVIHQINDATGFEAAEQKAMAAGLPDGYALPIHAGATDGTKGLCIWQGPSVEKVRELVDSVVGDYSTNEYFEVHVDGLPAE